MGVAALLVLVPLTIGPLLWLARETVVTRPQVVGGLTEGTDTLTLAQWRRILMSELSGNLFYRPLLHSVETAAGAAMMATGVGFALAWLLARTRARELRWIEFLGVLPFVMPTWTIALVWLAIFRTERAGAGAGIFKFLTGREPPEWVAYGAVPIIVVMGLHYFPFAMLLLRNTLENIDARLEEAAHVLGASKRRTFLTITLPLALPALLSSFLLVVARSIGAFGTPYLLGLPVRYYTLATMLYSLVVSQEASTGYALALVLIWVVGVVVAAQQKILGTRTFETVGGRGLRTRREALEGWKRGWLLGAGAVTLAAGVLPLVLLAWESLMRFPDNYSAGNLTLHYWIGGPGSALTEGEPGVLRNGDVLRAAANSVKLSLLTAVLAAFAGTCVARVMTRNRNSWIGRSLEQASFLPYVVPSIALSAVYLVVSLRAWGPIRPLYGTFGVLLLVCVLRSLPICVRSVYSGLVQIARRLEEAGTVLGARPLVLWVEIVAPVIGGGVIAGAVLAFVSTMRELGLIILLLTPETRVLTAMTFRYTEQGIPQMADAVIVLLIALTFAGQLGLQQVERWARVWRR
jgi:iron(III) transport system permease protein